MWCGRSAKDGFDPQDPRIETVAVGTTGRSPARRAGRRKPFAGPPRGWVPALALAVAAVGMPTTAQAAVGSSGPGSLTRFTNCGAFTDYMRRTTEADVGAYGFGGMASMYRRAAPMADGHH